MGRFFTKKVLEASNCTIGLIGIQKAQVTYKLFFSHVSNAISKLTIFFSVFFLHLQRYYSCFASVVLSVFYYALEFPSRNERNICFTLNLIK